MHDRSRTRTGADDNIFELELDESRSSSSNTIVVASHESHQTPLTPLMKTFLQTQAKSSANSSSIVPTNSTSSSSSSITNSTASSRYQDTKNLPHNSNQSPITRSKKKEKIWTKLDLNGNVMSPSVTPSKVWSSSQQRGSDDKSYKIPVSPVLSPASEIPKTPIKNWVNSGNIVDK